VAGDQPVEEHSDRREVLLDCRRLPLGRQIFDVRGDRDRANGREFQSPPLAPIEELTDGLNVSRSGVAVANCRGEEFDEATNRIIAGAGDEVWQLGDPTANSLLFLERERVRLPPNSSPFS